MRMKKKTRTHAVCPIDSAWGLVIEECGVLALLGLFDHWTRVKSQRGWLELRCGDLVDGLFNSTTVLRQVLDKNRKRFGLSRVVVP